MFKTIVLGFKKALIKSGVPSGRAALARLALFGRQRQLTGTGLPGGLMVRSNHKGHRAVRARVFGRAALPLLVLAALASGTAAGAAGLPPALEQAWKQTRLPESALSLVVAEVDGSPLADVNGQVLRNPASVMKLVSTWAGLAGLGPNYRWRTGLYAERNGQVDAQGTLAGPLYIKAGGDPYLTVPALWDLLRQLRLRGVKNLSEVVIDRSVFGQVAIDPGAFDGAGDRPYNASPDAMMVGLGAIRLLVQPDARAKKWVPIIDPPLQGIRLTGEIGWSEGRCPGPPVVTTVVSQQGGQVQVQLGGAVVGSCGEFSVYRLVQNQQDNFEATFRLLWKELGGTLGHGFRAGAVPAGARELVFAESAPLAELIRQINKQSNNVMARTLLLTLAAKAGGGGATAAGGARAALSLLANQGVDTRGWVIENGSGLSREARLTASGLVQMLEQAWRSPQMPEFLASLAISGVDGTVRRRLREDEVRGVAHLKTGSLRDTRAVAGYVLGASGKRYIVAVLVNHDNPASVRPFFDEVIRWTAAR